MLFGGVRGPSPSLDTPCLRSYPKESKNVASQWCVILWVRAMMLEILIIVQGLSARCLAQVSYDLRHVVSFMEVPLFASRRDVFVEYDQPLRRCKWPRSWHADGPNTSPVRTNVECPGSRSGTRIQNCVQKCPMRPPRHFIVLYDFMVTLEGMMTYRKEISGPKLSLKVNPWSARSLRNNGALNGGVVEMRRCTAHTRRSIKSVQRSLGETYCKLCCLVQKEVREVVSKQLISWLHAKPCARAPSLPWAAANQE